MTSGDGVGSVGQVVLRFRSPRRGVRAPDPARRRRHQAVVALVLGAFFADLVLGGMSPIFPLFAKRLGATSAELAGLVTAGGLTSLLVVFPAARLADRIGKRYVFSAGALLFGIAGLVLAVAPSIAVLAVPQGVLGVAGVCTWTVGIACLSDTVTGPALSKAVGLYTAAMGAGYGVGPLLTGVSVGAVGYRATFLWAGLLGVLTAGGALWGLVHARAGAAHPPSTRPGDPRRPEASVAPARRRPVRPSGTVLLASYVNLPTTLSINLALLTFFPVYAATLGWSTTVIGAILFERAMASSLVRLAMRSLQRIPLPPLAVIRVTLFVETAVVGLLALSRNLTLTVVLLAIEGANYGITMFLAQLTIVRGSDPAKSASSLVWYNAGGSVAQLAGGGLVALLVSGYTARGAIVIVMLICLALACTYAVLMTVRSRRSRGPARSSGAWQGSSTMEAPAR